MELNKVYIGNSLDLLRKIEDNSIDLVITSPPYANMKKYIDDDGIHADEYVEWFIPFCKEIERIIKPSGSFILNINDKIESGFRHPYVFDLISKIHKETNLKMFERLFWNKMKSLPHRSRFGDRVEFIFWFTKSKGFKLKMDEMRTEYSDKSIKRMKKPLKKRFSRTGADTELGYKDWAPNPKGALPTVLVNISSETKKIADSHVAVYPVELVTYFMKGSTDEGDLVLDPFMGTGTTGLVAKRLKRNYIGFDKQEHYVNIAEKRISDG